MKRLSSALLGSIRLIVLLVSLLVVGQLAAQVEINSYIASDTLVKWEDMADYAPEEVIALAGEDETYPITLPFAFQFFNNEYTEAFVSINGNVTFGRTYQGGDFNREKLCSPVAWDYDPAREQDALNPDNFIAVFWDDLFLDPACTVFGTPKLTQRVIGVEPNREVVITYDYFVRSGDLAPCIQDQSYGAILQAQVRLHETTNIIEVHHFNNRLSYDAPELPTVGVENEDGTYANYALCGTDSFPPEQAAWVFYPSETLIEDTATVPPTAGYCPLAPDSPCNFQWINSFECNNVLQDDGLCDRDESFDANGIPNDDGYSDYTDMVIEFQPEENTTAYITVDGNVLDQITIFIDWDTSGTWELDEAYFFVGDNFATDYTAAIVVPADAVLGTLVRGGVRVVQSFQDPVVDACASIGNGEVEDYSFYVNDPDLIACPTTISPAADEVNVCTNVNFNWAEIQDAAAYKIIVLDTLTNDTVDVAVVQGFNYSSDSLLASKGYKWSVSAIDSMGRLSYGCGYTVFSTTAQAAPQVSFSQQIISSCTNSDVNMNPIVTGGAGVLTYSWTGDSIYLNEKNVLDPIFNAPQSGIYTLYLNVEDANQCSDINVVEIDLAESPTYSELSVLTTSICPQDSLSITLSTSDEIRFMESASNEYSIAQFSSVAGSEYYFQNVDTTLIYHVELTRGSCVDTILVGTIDFIAPVDQPLLTYQLPTVGPCVGDSVLVSSSNYTTGILWSNGSNNSSIYVKSAADVSVKKIFAGGLCSVSSEILNIEFDSYPAVPVLSIDGDLIFCEGDSVGLSHSIVGDFHWSTGDNTSATLYFLDNAVVNIEAFSKLGCSTLSADYTIVKNAIPQKPSIIKLDYAVTDSLKSTVVSDVYHWTVDGQNVSFDAQVIPLLEEGLYRVSIESFDGCESEISEVLSTVGVRELHESPLKVVRHNGTVTVKSSSRIIKASLFSNDGKLLEKYKGVEIIEISNKYTRISTVLQVLTSEGYVSVRIN
tara:strand:- start:28254 stop:31238 length:2985 start_codon:yes stop_codon:yes gene_type:complete